MYMNVSWTVHVITIILLCYSETSNTCLDTGTNSYVLKTTDFFSIKVSHYPSHGYLIFFLFLRENLKSISMIRMVTSIELNFEHLISRYLSRFLHSFVFANFGSTHPCVSRSCGVDLVHTALSLMLCLTKRTFFVSSDSLAFSGCAVVGVEGKWKWNLSDCHCVTKLRASSFLMWHPILSN